MKTVAILGSTGSIGRNTLRVISQLKDRFRVIALGAGTNAELFAEQINKFRPRFAAIKDESKFTTLKKDVNARTKLLAAQEGIEQVADFGADIVVMAISGSAALLPTLKSLKKSSRLCLANKESLVMAGDIIMKEARKSKIEIIPIDSEHNAIFQCLKDESKKKLKKIYLTGSGGPLKDTREEGFEFVEPDVALCHPRWKMGKKITIDSATLMNKGFEVIEAKHLFNLSSDKIEILIHPEAVVHSLVQFVDGSILAQLGRADMRIPIQYALTYPERLPLSLSDFDFSKTRGLTFHLPDLGKFPCLKLALKVAREKGLAGCVLNASDEECVWAYLKSKIKITDIPKIIGKVLSRLKNKANPSLERILQTDKWAREQTRKIICGIKGVR